jgi:hypothetical protein
MEEYKINLLKLAAANDLQADLLWNEDLDFYVICNDLFFWGCADAEDIESQEDVDLYKKAIEDVGTFDAWASSLFCARKRKMRPQGAAYPNTAKSLWPLFDACGPERELTTGNPRPSPTE